MQSLSYWKQFESTGKVEDYLSYSGMTPEECIRTLRETKGSPKGTPTPECVKGNDDIFREYIPEGSVDLSEHRKVGSESL